MEEKYMSRNSHNRDEDKLGFEEHSLWPARNYGCSFCKREFRSAQALGGHMNVHRRDRARLRSSNLSSILVSDQQCPKPNPTATTLISSQSSLSDHELLNCAHPSSCLITLSSSPSPAHINEDKKKLTLTPCNYFPLLNPPQSRDLMSKMKGYEEEEEEEENVYKNNEENITLELGIGLFKHQEEKLDLELRL